MGTHAKGPSKISFPKECLGQLLSDWLRSNQWALGEAISDTYNGELPFLFKVLSINKALSIQAHPTKSHAEALHKAAPDIYRDPNHKPELAIAISDFEGFCGFRPFREIQGFVRDVPELAELVGEELCLEMRGVATDVESDESAETRKSVLKKVFAALMGSEGVVKETLARLVARLNSGRNGKETRTSMKMQTVLRPTYSGTPKMWIYV